MAFAPRIAARLTPPQDPGLLGYAGRAAFLASPPMPTSTPRRTFAVTSAAWFLSTLDRLVVTTALPTIRRDLGADVELLL